MTKRELKQYVYLKTEIVRYRKELGELGVTYNKTEGVRERYNVGRRAAKIIAKINECNELKTEIEMFVNSIPDSLTRQVFYCRYLKNMKWVEVAFAVGGNNTHEGVRKIAERYLKSKGV